MKKQFIQLTSGWIPVALLILLTAVFLASQANARGAESDAVGAVPAAVSPACDSGRLPLTTAALNGVARLVGANLRFEFDAGRLVSVVFTGRAER